METTNHLTQLLKSDYLTALIMSFVDFEDEVRPMVQLLSHKGKLFLDRNEEQIKYFWLVRPKPISKAVFAVDQPFILRKPYKDRLIKDLYLVLTA